MRSIHYTKIFRKDIKRAKKQQRDLINLKNVITKLANSEKLDSKYKDHKLIGNYNNRRECHLEPDFLLIYNIDKNDLYLERLGSHSELFKK